MTSRFFATLLLLCTTIGLGLSQDAGSSDPLPLRRVVIPVERVAAEVERAKPGVLLQLPRDEFEGKVRRAREAAAAAKAEPRLLKAVYAAQLSGTTLVGGSGHWQVQHDGPAPAMLPLPLFNLALTKIKLGNADGVLGDVDGKNFGLAVESPGRHDVFFDWSLRGAPHAEGMAFNFRLPSCPLSTIELKLPVGQTLLVDKNAGLVTGPLEAERPDVKVWRLQSSGRSQIEMVVRAAPEPSAPRLVLAALESKQQLTGSAVLADYEFRLEVVHGAVAELVFDGDEDLEPYEVTARGAELASWHTERVVPEKDKAPGEKKAKMSPRIAVEVRLREPLRTSGANVRIRCLARRDVSSAWRCPALRLRQAVPRGETLVLQAPAPLQIERFDAGQFRILASGVEPGGVHTVRLVDQHPEAPTPRRPRLWAVAAPADLATRERVRWSIAPTDMTLTTDIDCTLRRGSIYQLSVRLPSEPSSGTWLVDSVRMEPADGLRNWTLAGPLLLLNLQKALDRSNPVTVSVRLRASFSKNAAVANGSATHLTIPELRLSEANTRAAEYAIEVDPAWTATLARASVPLAPPAADPNANGPASPLFNFSYRDQALAGAIRLGLRRPTFTARVLQHVTLADSGGAVTAHLDLEPVAGQPEFVDLFFAGGAAQGWQAHDGDNPATPGLPRSLRMLRRPGPETLGVMSLLAARTPVAAALSAAQLPRGATFRLHLAKALKSPARVTLEGRIQPALVAPWSAALQCLGPALGWEQLVVRLHQTVQPEWAPQRWTPPIVSVLGAEHEQGAVLLHPQRHAVLQQQVRGLEEKRGAPGHQLDAAATAATAATAARLFQYQTHQTFVPPQLIVTTLPRGAAATPHRRIDALDVTHYVARDGSAHHHVQLRVRDWPESTLALTFTTPEATVLGAKLDGRWLDGVQQAQARDGLQVRVPVPRDDAVHRLEVLIASPAPTSWWAPLIRAPWVEPRLPAPVSQRRHLWRLAPGLAPLRREALHSLQPEHGTPAATLRRLWNAADSWISGWTPSLAEPWQQPQQRILERADAEVRRRLREGATFGDAIEVLEAEAVKVPVPRGGGVAVVLDRQALAALGLRHDTALSPLLDSPDGLWNELGLLAMPTPAGLLLSCPACVPAQADADSFESAVAAAAWAGQDGSGRFRRSDLWHRADADASAAEGSAGPWLALLGAGAAEGWSEWIPDPAASQTALPVVQTAPLHWLGIALAGALFLGLQRLRPRWRPAMAFRFLILSAVAMGFALFALPGSLSDLAFWPLLVVVVHLGAAWVRCRRRAPRGLAHATLALIALAAGIAGWQATTHVAAQTDDDDWLTVLYVDGGQGQRLALVRPELLKRLEAMQRRSAVALDSAVIVGAQYAARPQPSGDVAPGGSAPGGSAPGGSAPGGAVPSGAAVRIDVQLDAYSFSQRSTLHLPLAAVELLEGALIDGAPAFPAAAAAGKPGFVVPLTGQGFHRVTIAVLARPQPQGDYLEVRCGLPAAALNRVVWHAPASQNGLQLVKCAGAETTTLLDGGQTREIRAQLGRENVLHVRWLAAAAPSTVEHEVREAYWWDLDARAPTFTGQLRYAPSKTNLGHVEMALPPRLEIRSVEIASTGAVAAPRLARWQVLGKEPNRNLRLDLAAPAGGPFTVRLHGVPRLALDAPQLELRLPTPRDAKAVEGVVGYRLIGADAADKTADLNVAVLAPDVFAKVWSQHGGTATPAPTHAYSFRRAAAGAGLVLALRPAQPRGECEVAWQVQAERAEATARVSWTAAEPLNLVEVETPPGLKLTTVRGSQVSHWSVHERRVQIWLTQADTQATVELAGWLPKPLVKQRFALPAWSLPGTDATTTTVKLAAPTGWLVEPETVHNLQRIGTETPLTYRAAAPPYGGVFRMRPPTASAEFQAFTRVEPRGGALAVLTIIEARAAAGQLPAFTVRFRDWATPMRLEASLDPVEQSHRREGADQLWRLRFPARGGHRVRVELHSYVADAAPLSLPRLEIEGGTLREHWLGWSAERVQAKDMQGLTGPPPKLVAWLPEVEAFRAQSGTLWRTKPADKWQALVQSSASSGAPAVRVLHAEQHATLGDGRRWLHRASFLLHVKEARTFSVDLPADAEVVEAAVAGRNVQPFHAAGRRTTLPLPQRESLVAVTLAWQYPEATEPLTRPNLARPALEQEGVAIYGLLLAPPGLGIDALPAGWVAGDTRIALGRLRAVAGAQGVPTDIWPDRALHATRLERRLVHLLDIDPRLDAALPELRDEISRLGNEFRNAEQAPADFPVTRLGLPMPGFGLPLSWQASAGLVQAAEAAEGAPVIVLERHAAGPGPADWVRELLTLALISMFLLSWLPGGVTWLTRIWPEAIAGVALVGCVAWGWSAVGAALLLAAVLARLFTLAGGVRTWVFRPAPAASSSHG
jgi:hypothetical protein